eukprot:g33737.t1
MRQCQCLLKVFEEKGGDGPISELSVVPLFILPVQRSLVVTTHLYKPHIQAADVLTNLGRNVQLEGGSTDVVDPFGIWTSKRQVKATQNVNASGPEH